MEAESNQGKGECFIDIKTNAKKQLGSRSGSVLCVIWNRLLVTKKNTS
jgi:hypothetical protein